jgi:hypothetical protein
MKQGLPHEKTSSTFITFAIQMKIRWAPFPTIRMTKFQMLNCPLCWWGRGEAGTLRLHQQKCVMVEFCCFPEIC